MYKEDKKENINLMMRRLLNIYSFKTSDSGFMDKGARKTVEIAAALSSV